jgi:hypothetical protein
MSIFRRCWDCDSPVTFTISALLIKPNSGTPASAALDSPRIQYHHKKPSPKAQCESEMCGAGNYCMVGCANPTAKCGCHRDHAICSC